MSGLMNGLRHLIAERRRELEERQVRLARSEQQRCRLSGAIDRLDGLRAGLGASGAAAQPALAGNGAAYKQHLLELAQRQRQELQLQDADAAVQRGKIGDLAREEQALGLLESRLVERARQAHASSEQKRQDELGAQVWQRRLKAGAPPVALSSGRPDLAGEHHG